jgi:tryptophan halogenase
MSEDMDKRVQKIVIVGRDAAAWVSALVLQFSFGRPESAVAVELVELPSRLEPQDAYGTLPTMQAFHSFLGLDESRLLRASNGLYSLGQRFSNWSGGDSSFFHAYDTHGISLSQVEFFQYWLKARARGMDVPLDEFSLGAAAARHGRFVIFTDSTRAFSKASHGYNLDAIPYLKALGKAALKAGLRHTAGELADVEIDEGERVRAITLRDGTRVEGDLFIDASGPEACLMRRIEAPGNFESWRQWLPCDRLMVASAPALEPIPAFSQVSAFRHGWTGIFPLANRTVLKAGYSSVSISDQEVMQALTTLTGLRIDGEVVNSEQAPGGRGAHWIGNCVAVGDTATSLDALDAIDLHLLQTGLSYLVALFPVNRLNMPEAAVYNARLASHMRGVRDFQAAHFALNRRFGESFWDPVREQAPPESLAHKLRLFAARGVVSTNEEETFEEDSWIASLLGHGLVPKTWDPLVERIPEQDLMAHFQRILKFIAGEVESMPSLQAQLELNTPQSRSDYIFG